MAYRFEKEANGDRALVFDTPERGIAPSPHQGFGNMQAVNINTEQGEVMCSYSRVQQTTSAISTSAAALTVGSTSVLFVNVGITGSYIKSGSWIVVSNSTITGLANGNYYVISNNGSQVNQIQLSTTYSTSSSAIITGYVAGGSADVATLFDMAAGVQGATERYVDTTGATQYRYYVIDTNGRLWFQDTATYSGVDTPLWALPYTSTITSYNGAVTTTCTGMTVAFGTVVIFGGNKIFTIPTSRLGVSPAAFSAGNILSSPATTNSHFALAGKQGRIYYCDGNYIGSIFPDVSIDPSATTPTANIQSYCSYTASTTTGTLTAVLNGSVPYDKGTGARIPAFFFPAYGGTQPTNLVAGTRYWIEYTIGTWGSFQVFAAQTGGAAINIATGAAGVQYFNTFYPQSSDGTAVITFSQQRLALPAEEISTTIAELGNTIVVGVEGNTLYPWNQVDPLPSQPIPLPEAYTTSMVTVNNVIYVFAGFRGNIYITNASSVSLATSVPDYTTGLIEPYMTWGGSMFLRGRVYFSIKDQTSSHTGQCGGVWSFVPVQNFTYGQDYGIAMRIENKSSYNTYNGFSTVLIPKQTQTARGPQYFNMWTSSISSPTYGVDGSETTPNTAAVIQTDLANVGTQLVPFTPKQIEYKLAAPLVAGDSVAMAYRLNLSDAFVSCGSVVQESATSLSGYFVANFQNARWLQLQATLTPNASSTSSFVRLKEIRVR